MKRNHLAALGVLLAMTYVRSAAFAVGDNLVPNGDFDMDLAGWTNNYGSTAQWSPDDADGAPDSGSATLRFLSGGRTVKLTSDCVAVTGGTDYLFGVAQGSGYFDADGWVDLVWAEDASCDVPISHARVPSQFEAWTTTSRVVSAPANAASASVVLAVYYLARITTDAAPRASSLGFRFDNIILASACGGACGDVVPDDAEHVAGDATAGLVKSSDALRILRGATDEQVCPLCTCDVNDSGDVTATDALLTLAAATGGPVSLTCPAP